MRSINPKCSNNESFKYSILISLHYYHLNNHPERINKLSKYINKYNFSTSNYRDFENNNQSMTISVYNENKEIICTPKNNTGNKAHIVKINNHRYNALKPNKDKYIQLENVLKLFTHKELTGYLLRKVTY